MTLSKTTSDWLSKHDLEGFIRVVEAPPHEEPEKVATMIDLDKLSEGTMQARIGLPFEGLCSIENPSTKILTNYFGELSIASKAYQTHGNENLLFREVAWVLLEYVFVHPQPLSVLKNRVSFIIATFEGLKMDWSVIMANSLRVGMASVMDGKKAWSGLAQWPMILLPPTHIIKQKKRG